MSKLKYFYEYITVFLIGGIVYNVCELLWRGYSHWSMTIAGGLALMSIYYFSNRLPARPLWLQCLEGCLTITAIEFIIGYIVNIQLRWNVWDYSDIPFNIMGQVCLSFMALWFVLTIPAVAICRLLRLKLFYKNYYFDRGVLLNGGTEKKLRKN